MSKKKPYRRKGTAEHVKEFRDLFDPLARRFGAAQVFRDFCQMSAYALANAVDPARKPKREVKYLGLINSYAQLEDRQRFPSMLAVVVEALTERFQDFLGTLMNELELADAGMAQILTPYHVAELMADLTLHNARELIEEHGFITLSEPACGTGVMAIAAAENLYDQNINFQYDMHITCIDIDPRMAWAAYIQLSLLGVPAIVHVANTLSHEPPSDTFVTAMHVWRGWEAKLRGRREREADKAAAAAPSEGIELPIPSKIEANECLPQTSTVLPDDLRIPAE